MHHGMQQQRQITAQHTPLKHLLFFMCRCGHCQALTPEYKKAASALKGIVRLGAVDADEHRSLGSKYGVQGFPTIKVFGSNKKSPSDYKG